VTDRKLANRVRLERDQRGWSQQLLADAAGITRQVVATVETARHTPSVTVALALAAALNVTVEHLFTPEPETEFPATLDLPDGTPVRRATVGTRTVAVALPPGLGSFDGWGVADGFVSNQMPNWFDDSRNVDFVIAGCDPLLAVLGALAERRSRQNIICTHATTEAAIRSLGNGTAHAAFVHGHPAPKTRLGVARWKVAQWQVGLASLGATPPRLQHLAERNEPVVQRAEGAGSQASLTRALTAMGRAESLRGPIADGHLDVARRLSTTGRRYGAGLTMEAAAMAYGLAFAPLETHHVELWVDRRWIDHPATVAILDVLAGSALVQRANILGGYDMAGCGTLVSA
jgi:putative molybdopterin biosynthesis protein